MSDLRVLWWNVDWQRAEKNDAQIDAVLSLHPRPDVVALSELSGSRARSWRQRLRAEGYEFVRSPPRLTDRQLRVVLGSRLPIRDGGGNVRRFPGVWPRASRSVRLDLDGSEIDVHAVHIPNGSSNGWIKIDHLQAIRRAFQPPHPAPQVLCGDFNVPSGC